MTIRVGKRGPIPKLVREKLLEKATVVEGGCWGWSGKLDSYGRAFLMIGSKADGSRKNCRAARLSYEEFVGPIHEGLCVLHTCDNPSCINPEHLFLGTQADNMADKVAKGRQAKGKNHGWAKNPDAIPRGSKASRSKLTEEDIRLIRREYDGGGISQRALADRYGVSQRAVWAVLAGVTWGHVQ